MDQAFLFVLDTIAGHQIQQFGWSFPFETIYKALYFESYQVIPYRLKKLASGQKTLQRASVRKVPKLHQYTFRFHCIYANHFTLMNTQIKKKNASAKMC